MLDRITGGLRRYGKILSPPEMSAFPLRGYIDGFITSRDTDTDHDVNITAGVARDDTNAHFINSTSEFTKQIDAVWTAGDDAGGFPSGLTAGAVQASTWYHVFVIGSDSGNVDGGFDTSTSAANLMADATTYSYYRRIGSVLTDGSANVTAFVQVQDNFYWDSPKVETADLTSTAGDLTLTVPTGVRVVAHFGGSVDWAATTNYGVIHIKDITDIGTVDKTTTNLPSGSTAAQGFNMSMLTNTSGVVRWDSSEADPAEDIITYGWTDFRGRNA